MQGYNGRSVTDAVMEAADATEVDGGYRMPTNQHLNDLFG